MGSSNKGIVTEREISKIFAALNFGILRSAGSGNSRIDACDTAVAKNYFHYGFESKKKNGKNIYVTKEQHESFLRFGKKFCTLYCYYVLRFRKNDEKNNPKYTNYYFVNAETLIDRDFTKKKYVKFNFSNIKSKMVQRISIKNDLTKDDIKNNGFNKLEETLQKGDNFVLSDFQEILKGYNDFLQTKSRLIKEIDFYDTYGDWTLEKFYYSEFINTIKKIKITA